MTWDHLAFLGSWQVQQHGSQSFMLAQENHYRKFGRLFSHVNKILLNGLYTGVFILKAATRAKGGFCAHVSSAHFFHFSIGFDLLFYLLISHILASRNVIYYYKRASQFERTVKLIQLKTNMLF